MSVSTHRRHDIDALRAIAFGLLILYHVGMFYVPWAWHVKSAYTAPWLETPMLFLNQWRMPLVFLVSGLAVNFLLGEGGARRMGVGRFARLRISRLGWPLLFGMLIVVPPQAYQEALANGATEPGYAAFLRHYFTFQAWQPDAFAGSDPGITWNHLWYLPYLLFYTLVLAAALRWLGPVLAALRRQFRRLRGLALALAPVTVLIPVGIWVFPRFPYISHDLLNDWYAHAMYGTFFLVGFLLGRDSGLWAELTRLRWPMLGVASLAFAGMMGLREITVEPLDPASDIALLFLVYLNRWGWLMVVLGWGHRWLNRPMPWLNYANRAVYPWYVLHQTLIVVGGAWLASLELGPVAEPLALILITAGGCALIMGAIERFAPWLGPALGLKIISAQSRKDAGHRKAPAAGVG